MAEKIVTTTCGENKEEIAILETCGCLVLVINQSVASIVVLAMHLWRGGWRRGTKHPLIDVQGHDDGAITKDAATSGWTMAQGMAIFSCGASIATAMWWSALLASRQVATGAEFKFQTLDRPCSSI